MSNTMITSFVHCCYLKLCSFHSAMRGIHQAYNKQSFVRFKKLATDILTELKIINCLDASSSIGWSRHNTQAHKAKSFNRLYSNISTLDSSFYKLSGISYNI